MEQDVQTSGSETRKGSSTSAARRIPVWLYIVVGVLLVALAGTAALVLSNRGGSMAQPEAEVVTLPVPTPTVDPIAREEGTAFAAALPSTVLAFAMSESAPTTELDALGPLEAYRLAYTDGSSTLGLLAAQWATPEEATTAYETLLAASPDADAAPTTGEVEVDGSGVGSYTMATLADGSGVLTWSNGTAVLQLSGPADELMAVYSGFTL